VPASPSSGPTRVPPSINLQEADECLPLRVFAGQLDGEELVLSRGKRSQPDAAFRHLYSSTWRLGSAFTGYFWHSAK
jgi:hypothetical protein